MSVETIGSYRLTELLGSGAMGEVYKATDAKMFDRVVALKLLSEKFARNENARSRFRLEVQYASHLDHPNIIKIYDQGEYEGRPYFVMEFLDGIDLARFMRAEPNRTIERDVEIARQLCEALDFAHKHNVVHRDIKPANVMIVKRPGGEQVKLVDFGIIHVDNSNMTRDGTQPGTSAYSSPEQLRNDPLDHRSDLFSLGIVLYELFTGAHPFDGPSEAMITHAILQREPESPRKKNAAVPAAIDVLILKLLEKDPTQRPQTAGEVAEALRQQLRKLHSRWASTDPAEYENLDEITREAVDKLVAWARQKEADGANEEAVRAYEKALNLAPESERIQRRITKLRHRIESDRALADHLAKAEAAFADKKFPEAREHLKQAWILSPESEDVAALELRLKNAEAAVPKDDEKKTFVDGLLRSSQEALDRGALDEARGHVVQILQRYPQDATANGLLERILAIMMSGVDFRAYRAALAEAAGHLDAARLSQAKEACARASALWPGDEEVAAMEREVAARTEAETRAAGSRVEQALLRADDPEADEAAAAEQIAAARSEISRARASGGDEARLKTLSEEADRIERALKDRAERARSFQLEQEEQRKKRIDTFLQSGRSFLSEAALLASRVTMDPAPAVEKFRQAQEAFERVLQEDAAHHEALEARKRIESDLRELAERVERHRERQVEVDGGLESARTAVAQADIAGGGRAGDPAAVLQLLDEADRALDAVGSIDPSHADIAPLRERTASMRAAARRLAEEVEAKHRAEEAEAKRRANEAETARRAEEAEAKRRAEEAESARRAEEAEAKRRAEEAETARRAEEAEAARPAEETDAKRRVDEAAAKRRAEQAEAKREEEQAEAMRRAEAAELERRARASAKEPAVPDRQDEHVPAPEASAGPDTSGLDPRKLHEFHSGLKKYRRLMEQGRRREAEEIRRILAEEAATDARLQARFEDAFPTEAPRKGKMPLLIGGIAAVVVVGAIGAWIALRPSASTTPEPASEPSPSAPIARATPPPQETPVAPPQETAPSPPPTEAPVAAVPPVVREPAPKPTPPPPKPRPKPEPKTATAPPPKPRPTRAPEPTPPPKPAATTPVVPTAPAGKTPQESGRPAESGTAVAGTLLGPDGKPLAGQNKIVFQVFGPGAGRQTVSTDASGHYRFPIRGLARIRAVQVVLSDGRTAEVVAISPFLVIEGETNRLDVQVRKSP